MREWLVEPAGTAILAFVTTLHCALALLRKDRSQKTAPLSVIPSFLFAVFPWFLSSPLWLAIAFVAHLSWFAACERFLPKAPPPAPQQAPPPRKPGGFQPLRVLATFEETPGIRSFRFARPPDFVFRPGQFVMVRVESLVRCYSITTAPATPGYFEIAVRNQGVVSRRLHETLRPGMTLEVQGPGGAFTYPSGDRPLVLLAGGIGITPLLSMLRHGLASDPTRGITLLFSARDTVPFEDELRLLQTRHPQFRLVLSPVRIDRALLDAAVPRPSHCVFMICGPLSMIDAMRALLATMGVPQAQVHFEKFEAALSLAAGGAAARLTLRRSKKTVDVHEGQTILEAAEAAGVSLPSLCRVGVCGTCRTRVLSGEVDGDFDAIDASEQAEGYVLACVARPRSDCVIDA